MIEDYCNKLQQINRQKNQFLKLKYKSSAKSIVEKQENKYHKYILSQISYKNKLDSLLKLNQILNKLIRHQKRPLFDAILSHNQLQSKQQSRLISSRHINSSKHTNTQTHNEMENELSILKAKLKNTSCNFLLKGLLNIQKKNLGEGFKEIKRKNKINSAIHNIFNLIERKTALQKSIFLHNFSHFKRNTPKKQSKSFIFSLNQFSEIIPYTIQQESEQLSISGINNIEQIDMKYSPESQQKIQLGGMIQNEQNEYKLLIESFHKLKEQVTIMKNLLGQKNKLIKQKDEQIYKTKKQYENKIENLHDEISSKIQRGFKLKDSVLSKSVAKSQKSQKCSDSYIKQLQTHIIGDRSPQGDLQSEDNLGSQLLNKYMKECFEMREKMDMAREMCQQFEFDSKTQQGQVMMEIIKLLTPEERLNIIVD